MKEYKTEHISRYTKSGVSIGAGTTGIYVGYGVTGNINIGDSVGIVTGAIGSGTTVTVISNTTIYINPRTTNTSTISGQTLSFGSTVFTGYNIREYDDRDIYDEYSNNDEFETAADDIIDFAESNPFGTF